MSLFLAYSRADSRRPGRAPGRPGKGMAYATRDGGIAAPGRSQGGQGAGLIGGIRSEGPQPLRPFFLGSGSGPAMQLADDIGVLQGAGAGNAAGSENLNDARPPPLLSLLFGQFFQPRRSGQSFGCGLCFALLPESQYFRPSVIFRRAIVVVNLRRYFGRKARRVGAFHVRPIAVAPFHNRARLFGGNEFAWIIVVFHCVVLVNESGDLFRLVCFISQLQKHYRQAPRLECANGCAGHYFSFNADQVHGFAAGIANNVALFRIIQREQFSAGCGPMLINAARACIIQKYTTHIVGRLFSPFVCPSVAGLPLRFIPINWHAVAFCDRQQQQRLRLGDADILIAAMVAALPAGNAVCVFILRQRASYKTRNDVVDRCSQPYLIFICPQADKFSLIVNVHFSNLRALLFGQARPHSGERQSIDLDACLFSFPTSIVVVLRLRHVRGGYADLVEISLSGKVFQNALDGIAVRPIRIAVLVLFQLGQALDGLSLIHI